MATIDENSIIVINNNRSFYILHLTAHVMNYRLIKKDIKLKTIFMHSNIYCFDNQLEKDAILDIIYFQIEI